MKTEELKKTAYEARIMRFGSIYTLTYDSLKESESSEDRRIAKELDEKYKGLMWRYNKVKDNTEVPLLESLPYSPVLSASRKVLEDNILNFPERCCDIAAKVISRIEPELEEVRGDYKYDSNYYDSFNFDFKRGLFVSITMNQYKECNDPITVFPASTDILTIEEIPTKDQWMYDRVDINELVNKIKSILEEGK